MGKEPFFFYSLKFIPEACELTWQKTDIGRKRYTHFIDISFFSKIKCFLELYLFNILNFTLIGASQTRRGS